MALDFEKERLVSELKKRKPKKILVQLAEGIKQNAPEISELIEQSLPGAECIFSGETCWGACSVAVQEAQALGADLIVHFGHAEFIKVGFPVLYIEVKDILDLKPLLDKSLPHLKAYDKIGLSYSIQHRHDAENIKKFYESHEKKVAFSKKAGTNAYEGHITGCEYLGLKAIQDEVDCFVIVGNQFHSMGAVLSVRKPVILVDVYNDNVRNMEGLRERILKQRFFSIEKLKKAKNVGIIIEIKLGQKFGSPRKLLEKFKQAEKNAVVITMSEITPEKMMNFYDIDAFVELACPRIALDDFEKYPKPILTMKEALVALGEKSWEDLLKTGLV
jgi:2-(3-amino-3-carboxypropyl)histidine synthase